MNTPLPNIDQIYLRPKHRQMLAALQANLCGGPELRDPGSMIQRMECTGRWRTRHKTMERIAALIGAEIKNAVGFIDGVLTPAADIPSQSRGVWQFSLQIKDEFWKTT